MSEPGTETTAGARGGRRLSSAGFAAVLLVALTALAIALGVTRHSGAATGRDASVATGGTRAQQAVLAAARAEGAAVTTLSWRSADSDLGRILTGALPGSELYKQFAAQRADLPKVLARNHSVSQGTVLASALSSLGADSATVMVAVDANISGSNGAPTVKHYRMVFAMRRSGSRWLATGVSFQGPPQ